MHRTGSMQVRTIKLNVGSIRTPRETSPTTRRSFFPKPPILGSRSTTQKSGERFVSRHPGQASTSRRVPRGTRAYRARRKGNVIFLDLRLLHRAQPCRSPVQIFLISSSMPFDIARQAARRFGYSASVTVTRAPPHWFASAQQSVSGSPLGPPDGKWQTSQVCASVCPGSAKTTSANRKTTILPIDFPRSCEA